MEFFKYAQRCFLTILFCTVAYVGSFGQWSEHPTPSAESVSSLGFIGNDIYAIWDPTPSFGYFPVHSQNGNPWVSLAVPPDNNCPGNLCYPRILTSENGHLYYASPQWPGFVFKSDDAGASWETILPLFTDYSEVFFSGDRVFYTDIWSVWMTEESEPQSVNVFSSTDGWGIGHICKQNNNNLLLIDGVGIHQSTDQGDTWNLLTAEVKSEGFSFKDVSMFAFGNAIYVSFRNLGMYISQDGGNNWILQPFPGNEFINTMQQCSGVVLAGDTYQLYISNDQGSTWTAHTASPPPITLEQNGGKLYMGSTNGVYWSEDCGKNWHAQNAGLERHFSGFTTPVENKSVFSFANKLYVANGYGLYETSDEGANWRSASNLKNIREAVPAGHALIVRNDGQLDYKWHISHDTAQTWQQLVLPTALYNGRNPVVYSNGELFTFVDLTGYKSSDFGQTWTPLAFPFANVIRQAIVSQGKIFATTYGFAGVTEYYISADNGINWQSHPFGAGSEVGFFGNENELYAYFGPTYFHRENDQWKYFYLPAGQKLLVDDQVVFAYRAENQYVHTLKVSSDMGQHWADLISAQPFLTDGDFDPGANTASGLHQQGFYAFGRSATDASLPVLWKLDIGDIDNAVRVGNIYYDENNNGARDNNEKGISNLVVSTSEQPVHAISDNFGNFSLFFSMVGDTLTPYLSEAIWSSNPPYHLIAATQQSYEFGITVPSGIIDLNLHSNQESIFRPGFSSVVDLIAGNTGADTTHGIIKFWAPSDLVLLNANPPPSAMIDDTLIWETDLLPFGRFQVELSFQTPASLPIGTLLNFYANIEPNGMDNNPNNNSADFSTIVLGSFDPNDKAVIPSAVSKANWVDGEWLDYFIRFQNTGNYPAQLVRLVDTLDTRLDISSIQFLGASHPCSYVIREGNILEAIFNDIYLTDTLTSEQESHGYARFSIFWPRNTMNADTLRNRAGIYFDYNAPVITNDAKTWLELFSDLQSVHLNENCFEVNPNPSNNYLNITPETDISLEGASIIIVDMFGKIRKKIPYKSKINISEMTKGVYFIILKTRYGFCPQKIIIN